MEFGKPAQNRPTARLPAGRPSSPGKAKERFQSLISQSEVAKRSLLKIKALLQIRVDRRRFHGFRDKSAKSPNNMLLT
jgi:hypothetical protein